MIDAVRNGTGPLGGKPVIEMTQVEIAEQLERVTGWIEAERAKEREARQQYQAVASQVEANVASIQKYANELVSALERKISQFSGMLQRPVTLGITPPAGLDQHTAGGAGSGGGLASVVGGPRKGAGDRSAGGRGGNGRTGKLNLPDAICAIWDLPQFREALTTEEIGEALDLVGYTTNAAPASIKSSINQALAKLCHAGRIIRYRSDGSTIPIRDTTSRARKYLSAKLAPEPAE